MGSTKKHKKDRESGGSSSKKHKHRKRESPPIIVRDSNSREREPASYRSSINNNDSINRKDRSSSEREQKIRKNRHHKKHKDRKQLRQRAEPVEGRDRDHSKIDYEYHSDSSDVIEVPIAPPAPTISEPLIQQSITMPIVSPPPAPIISAATTSSRKRRSRTRSSSPIPDGGLGDCLSITDTNKLRAKLGLKPLETNSQSTEQQGSGLDNKKSNENQNLNVYKDEWGEFHHKPADNIAEKLQAEKIREKIRQRREKRSLEDKLKTVKTLGEKSGGRRGGHDDDDIDDIAKWVDRNREKEKSKREAEKRERMLTEMDEQFGVSDLIKQDIRDVKRDSYQDRHLHGLKVAHDLNDFQEGKTVILTLKDHDILDEEDDSLININMIDKERYKKNVENKKLKPGQYGYNAYEDVIDEYGEILERNILNKYDEEIGDIKKKSFKIGENIQDEIAQKRRLLEIKSKLSGKRLETLNEPILRLASDNYTEDEMAKFKKPKKKIKKIRQKSKIDELELDNVESVTNSSKDHGRRKRIHLQMNVDDNIDDNETNLIKYEEEDNDLEQMLSKARRLKQKESIIMKSLELEESSMQIDENEIKMQQTDNNNGNTNTDYTPYNDFNILSRDNIILNSTAEFCRTLGDIPTYGMSGNRDEDANNMLDFDGDRNYNDEDDGDDINNSYNKYINGRNMHIDEHEQAVVINVDEDVDDHDELKELEERYMGSWNSINPNLHLTATAGVSNDTVKNTTTKVNEVTEVAILDEEPDVGSGMGAALKLAISKGYLEKEEKNRPSTTRMAHLQAKNYSIEDKAYAEDEKFNRRDRYHSGPISDFKERDLYKPNVKLEYIDDNGRILNEKEAFRYLSHKFHGKGPGKNKIEKRLKKSEQEVLMMKMSSTDTPLGTLTMLQHKQKETHSPYIVLSGSKQTHATATSITKNK